MAGHTGKRNSVGFNDLSAGERRRTLTLHELRPLELIGRSTSLFPWHTKYVEDTSRFRSKKTREFYENQNEVIETLQFVDALLDTGIHASLIEDYSDDIGEDAPRQRQPVPQSLETINYNSMSTNSSQNIDLEAWCDNDSSSGAVHYWINLNMAVNVLLLVAKVVVYYTTQSLSIGASLIDSVLDLFSTLIIFVSTKFADKRDWQTKQLYPVGRYRLEPIGILVFSVMMIVSFIKVGEEALQQLISSDELMIVQFGIPSLIVMVGTLAIKGIIWQLCKHVKNSSVRALSQDALTDCYFNFFSIVFPLFSQYFRMAELDPLGALLLSLYVVWSWGQTAMEHIDNLTGAVCSPLERQQILYLCIRFSERIKYVTALNAYHAGDRLMVEVDILLDPSLSMRDSHDIAESLQYALETMHTVERAFVHIDYRRGNFTGHVV